MRKLRDTRAALTKLSKPIRTRHVELDVATAIAELSGHLTLALFHFEELYKYALGQP
jgi:hypothetical protein